MPLQILTYPHAALRKVSLPVESINDTLRAIADQMMAYVKEIGALGLAAPQIGINQCFLVMGGLTLINPTLSHFEHYEVADEECLSLPGVRLRVRRAKKVTVHAYLLDGTEFNRRLKDLPARVAQHEVDHLLGKLIIDRAMQE